MNNGLPEDGLPSRSWEIMAYAIDLFEVPRLSKFTGLKPAQIYRFAKNPDIYEDACRNHIDRAQILIRKIVEEGGEEGRQIARIALNLIAKDCGFKVVNTKPAIPATNSSCSEFLELFSRLNDLQMSAKKQDNPLVVGAYTDAASDALAAFLVRYTTDYQEQGGIVKFCKTKPPKASLRSFWAKIRNFKNFRK
ncbi:hypothetical protein [Maridesulfovibrio ferrireducens]|uniref:hypothetical protein n=1 Tax=Maridesulfovibrio ferrireducens TaxID=246191 RepID=UPI001A34CA31|nr:hypothetical protein [Maridesulfovibrio ferrireducens]MBI9113290.1 hypothetical protein [Maridesulfovibrio ferrireducens]